MKGIVRQGVRCKDCAISCHKHCKDYVVIDCKKTKEKKSKCMCVICVCEIVRLSVTIYMYKWLSFIDLSVPKSLHNVMGLHVMCVFDYLHRG